MLAAKLALAGLAAAGTAIGVGLPATVLAGLGVRALRRMTHRGAQAEMRRALHSVQDNLQATDVLGAPPLRRPPLRVSDY
jgi:hypothetical protein